MKTFTGRQRVISYFNIAVFLLLFSCSDSTLKKKEEKNSQPDLTQEEMRRLVLLDTSYIYPIEQVRLTALSLAQQFLNKDGKSRAIEKILTVPSLYTLEGKTQIKTDFSVAKPKTPALYIANFEKEAGYVILSADKRATEIIATVGSGTIDSLAHPGLQVFLSNAIIHIDEKVAELETLRGDDAFRTMVEKLELSLSGKATDEKNQKPRARQMPCFEIVYVPGESSCSSSCYYYSSTIPIMTVNFTNVVRSPLLTTLWDQGPPYNNGQPNGACNTDGDCGSNSRYPAGCVAIAEAQVVAHFKAKYDPIWNSIAGKRCDVYNQEERDLVSWLAHAIYIDYGIFVDRECGEVAAGFEAGDIHFTDPRGISPSYGLVEGEWRGWNTGDIRNSLVNGSPVVIQGKKHLCCFIWCWGCGGGHEWVIDGIRDLGVRTTYQFSAYYVGDDCGDPQLNYYESYTYQSNNTTATQIHQNWGWGINTGSQPNDWYAQNVFQSSYQVLGWDNNYNHANYIVAYITPN
jgi:hypothetical protein